MLLWLPKSSTNGDDDEKAAKLKRQARLEAQRRINILGVVCIVIFIAIARIDQRDYKSPKVRSRESRSRSVSRSTKKSASRRSADTDDFFAGAMPPLPSNSVYNLEYPDILGKSMKLSRFAGKVTLFVNTACL